MRKYRSSVLFSALLIIYFCTFLGCTSNVFSEDTESMQSKVLLDKARALRDQDVWSKSISHYQSYLNENPHNFIARKEVGVVYGWNEDWANAKKNLEEYLKEYPNDVEAIENLASAYLYDGNAEKAKDLFAKVIELDPSREASLKDQIAYADRVLAPYLTYSFYQYREKNRKEDTTSTTLNHEWEWYQHIKNNFYIIPTFGIRIDDDLYKKNYIYGIGIMFNLLKNVIVRVSDRFEKNRRLNPRHTLSVNLDYIISEKDQIAAGYTNTWYWDGNASYAPYITFTHGFLEDNSLRATYGYYYYNAKNPSAYFSRFETGEEREPGEHLQLHTHAVSFEKDLQLHEKFIATLGTSMTINTDETRGITPYLRLNWIVNDSLNVVGAGSYGRDSDHYEYISGSFYGSLRF